MKENIEGETVPNELEDKRTKFERAHDRLLAACAEYISMAPLVILSNSYTTDYRDTVCDRERQVAELRSRLLADSKNWFDTDKFLESRVMRL